jgi:hypothetical protein
MAVKEKSFSRFRTTLDGSIVTRSIAPGRTVIVAVPTIPVSKCVAVMVAVPAPTVRTRLRPPGPLSATATVGSLEV